MMKSFRVIFAVVFPLLAVSPAANAQTVTGFLLPEQSQMQVALW